MANSHERKFTPLLLLIPLIFPLSGSMAQPEGIRKTITEIGQTIPGEVGVAVTDLSTGDTLSVNGDRRFPMQSVFKFHIALAALRQVDEGKLLLDRKVHVTKDHYYKTWSVLMRDHPDANIDVTLGKLIELSAKHSDNVACDLLLDILGGPSRVEHFIKDLGIDDIAIPYNERQMHTDWLIPFDNWTTPNATTRLLRLFDEGKILKPESSAFLWTLMTETPNAPKRLKGQLPGGTIVARKPGTGATNNEGVLGAANDVGIMVLPDGRKVIVAVYVTKTKETLASAEAVIARISKAVYEYYLKR